MKSGLTITEMAQEIDRQSTAKADYLVKPTDMEMESMGGPPRPRVLDIARVSLILGYPNWWASIPMPIASFLEEYDFSGKTIIPFCIHGGGCFGQSLTAITKLVPDAVLGEGLAISYFGGPSLADDVAEWLTENDISIN